MAPSSPPPAPPPFSGAVRDSSGGLSPAARRNGARAAGGRPPGTTGGVVTPRRGGQSDPGSGIARRQRIGCRLDGRTARLRGRAAELARLRRLRAGAEERFPVITRLTSHLIAVNLLDSATRLAAQVFLTAVPLLFVVASFAPQGVNQILVSSARRLRYQRLLREESEGLRGDPRTCSRAPEWSVR